MTSKVFLMRHLTFKTRTSVAFGWSHHRGRWDQASWLSECPWAEGGCSARPRLQGIGCTPETGVAQLTQTGAQGRSVCCPPLHRICWDPPPQDGSVGFYCYPYKILSCTVFWPYLLVLNTLTIAYFSIRTSGKDHILKILQTLGLLT